MNETPLIKFVVLFLLVLIVASLGSGLYALFKQEGNTSTRTVRALTLRVGLSVALFALLMGLSALGIIEPR